MSAAASAPAAPNVVGLKKGAYGDAVKALQEALVRVGVGVKYGVDSYFGSATQASVKAFQRYKGLPVTGVVDQATAAALGLAAAPAAPAAAAAGRTGDARPRRHRPARQAAAAGADRRRHPVPGGADGIFGVGTERAAQGVPAGQGPRRHRHRRPGDAARPRRRRQARRTGRRPPRQRRRPRRRSACASAPRPGRRVRSSRRSSSMGWTLRGGADGDLRRADRRAP